MNDEPKKIEEVNAEANEEVVAEFTKAGASAIKETETAPEIFAEGEGQLAVDVYQTPEEIVIEAPVAGVSPEDLDISISSDAVTIKGRRVHEERVREDDYLYQECYWGRFSRSVILPQEIDTEKVQASLKNGILRIHLPKVTRTKSKKIKVKFD